MIRVDAGSGVPLEEQIRSGLKELVLRGLLKPGDELPQARELAETLRISPASVTRAYRAMAKDGFLAPGAGRFLVSEQAWQQSAHHLVDAVQDLLRAVQAGRHLGLEWQDLESVLQMMKAQETQGPGAPASEVLRRLGFFGRNRAGSGPAQCPYCRAELRDQEIACCAVCGTAHHQDCWNESGRCSVYGCRGTVPFPFAE